MSGFLLLWVCLRACAWQRDRVAAELASIRPALAAEQARARDVEAECAGLRKELDAARDSAVKLAAMLEGTRAELEEVRGHGHVLPPLVLVRATAGVVCTGVP